MPAPSEALRVGGVLLAAGASQRMGVNKLLEPLAGATLIEHVAGAAIAAGVDPLVVVLGRDADAIRTLLAPRGCRFAFTAGADSTSSSLHRGLEALAGVVDAVVVLLADMPLVSPAMLHRVIDTARRVGAAVVASRYGGVIAPPVLFRRALFPELMAWHGDDGPKPIVERHRADAVFVDWPVDLLCDVDTREDLTRLRNGKQSLR